MGNALLGGILIGLFVKGWLGVFILPVIVAIYQCIALFFQIKRMDSSKVKGLSKLYSKINFNTNKSLGIIWFDSMRIYAIQFGWTYITSTGFAVVAHFMRIIIFK
jgi:hypothetical protein